MDFSVLTPDFRKQLEQQRSRLHKERDEIVAQAAQAVDANINHINALLGETTAAVTPTKRPYNRKTVEESSEVRVKRAYNRKQPTMKAPKKSKIMDQAIASDSNAPKSKSTVTKAKKVKAPKSKPNPADFPTLKSEYATLTPAQAIAALFQSAPKKVFNVDDVIAGIYDAIDEQEMARTRQRIGVTLGHCARREECVKVDGEIAQYRLNA
ncbi:MAG: hypothetical protein NT070_04140 [Cyanobacteria bacterium]|nr:hypothetical protein [Cyanobacteriota bacterium]